MHITSTLKKRLTRTVSLVGIMGCGKSTIGKRLGKKLGLQFYDTDKLIEERTGLSIVDIYDLNGETYFKQKEYEVVTQVLSYGPVIMSTGGNTFLDTNLRGILKKNAISIWLSASLDVLHERVMRKDTRPEFNQGDTKILLSKMIEERYPVYSEADITVESENQDAHHIVDTIIVRLLKHIEESNNSSTTTNTTTSTTAA